MRPLLTATGLTTWCSSYERQARNWSTKRMVICKMDQYPLHPSTPVGWECRWLNPDEIPTRRGIYILRGSINTLGISLGTWGNLPGRASTDYSWRFCCNRGYAAMRFPNEPSWILWAREDVEEGQEARTVSPKWGGRGRGRTLSTPPSCEDRVASW